MQFCLFTKTCNKKLYSSENMIGYRKWDSMLTSLFTFERMQLKFLCLFQISVIKSKGGEVAFLLIMRRKCRMDVRRPWTTAPPSRNERLQSNWNIFLICLCFCWPDAGLLTPLLWQLLSRSTYVWYKDLLYISIESVNSIQWKRFFGLLYLQVSPLSKGHRTYLTFC